ncbi:MAG: twin-arginine translocase TatA/TatE family subunit [Chloroflexi bacterium]|nr:twin-arginine translocase TatA/TatE family subunit [Chloroflexota bacterium]
MELFGVGAMEALLVMVVALIVVGPHRFPEIARQGGRWYRIARRYANEVTKDVRGAMDELQTELEEEGSDLRAIRDLGKEMDADLRATKLDLDEMGADTARAAEHAGDASDSAASRDGPSTAPPASAPADPPADATSGSAPDGPSASPNVSPSDGEPAR